MKTNEIKGFLYMNSVGIYNKGKNGRKMEGDGRFEIGGGGGGVTPGKWDP